MSIKSKVFNSKKQTIIANSQTHKTDTGTPETQIALLTERITRLTEHAKLNKKDHSSRRGLLRAVGRRRKLLNYVLRQDVQRYLRICKANNIKPVSQQIAG